MGEFEVELRQLRAVIAVDEEGSFRAAATRLHLTQPALSHQIKALEQELGCMLFTRGGKRVYPTAAGRRLIQVANTVVAMVDAIPEKIRPESSNSIEPLRVGHIPGALLGRMRRAINLFRGIRPEIPLAIKCGQILDIVRGLDEGRLDVGIVVWSSELRAYQSMPLYVERLAALVRRGPSENLRELTLHDLGEVPLVLYPSEHHVRILLDTTLLRNRIPRRVAFEADNDRIIRRAVEDGFGVAVLAESVAQRLKGNAVYPVPIADSSLQYVVAACWNASTTDSSVIGDFVQSLAKLIPPPKKREAALAPLAAHPTAINPANGEPKRIRIRPSEARVL